MTGGDLHALLCAIREHSGMEDDEIREAGEYGADTGWPEFTYTADGARFYRENDELIDALAAEEADEMGYDDVAALVASFTRSDMAQNRDGRDCLMAWWALETAGRYHADRERLRVPRARSGLPTAETGRREP